MRWILGSSLRFSRLVVGAAAALLVLGIIQMRGAQVEVYPEFMPPTVQIQTEALGLSAAEVEQLVTLGLEQNLLNGVPWLDHIHSRSEPGLSVIDLVFRPGTDLYAARQMVQERLTQAHALPAVGSGPLMIQPLASVNRVAMIGLSSRTVSPIDMSVLARWQIRPRLMAVPGVANVSIYGQRDRQLQVQVDPARLAGRGVTLSQIIDTTGNALWVSPLTFVEASTPGTGGFVESPNQRLAIQNVLPISNAAQLAAVPVDGTPAGTLRLGDVADVVEDHQPLIGDAVVGGAPGLFLVIDKFPDANTLDVTRAVEKAMAGMRPGLPGITVDSSVYRPATFIQSALHTVGLAALLGFLLLLALLLATFASWRAALISAVAIPTSLLAAAYVLYLRGGTFTTMTLLGLAAALAVVIDDAVGDVDALRRRRRERRDAGEGGPLAWIVIESCQRVRGTMVFATLIILLGILPFLVLGSLTTAFTRPLVLTYALALLASMVVALTLTPTLAVLLSGTATAPAGPSPFARWVRRGFDRCLAGSIPHPDRAWAVVGVLVLATIAFLPHLGGRHALLPRLQDRNLLMHVEAAPGTSLPEMDRITTAMGRELRGIAGVRDVGAHVGRAVSSDQTTDVNTAEMWINLAGDIDYPAAQAAIRAVARGYPGVATDLVTYPSDRVAAVAAGYRDDLVVRVYGQDFPTLQAKVEQIRTSISGVPGVVAARVVPQVQEPTAQIEVNLAAAQRYGLKPGDIRRDATTLTSGLVAGTLYEQAKIFDVVVVGDPATRASLSSLRGLRLDTPSGGQVRLGDVASVRIAPQPTAIIHDEVSRSAEVVASIRGRSAADVAADVRARVAAMPMPPEYHAQVLGNATVAQQDTRRAVAYGVAALLAILLLLQAATASWRRAGVLLLVLPLACVGAVLASPLAGGVWSAGALAGVLAVFALAVRGCLSLARRIRELEQAQAAESAGDTALGPRPEQAVLTAARERAVPVVQTALAVTAVLLPVLLLGDRAGLEILRPFAVTVLGGLVTSTVVTLFVLPGLHLAVTPRSRRQEREPEPIAVVVPV